MRMRDRTPDRTSGRSAVLLAVAALATMLAPSAARRLERARVADRVRRLALSSTMWARRGASRRADQADWTAVDPSLLVRVEELDGLVASWQTIGGCGAGAGAASSAGLKWIGRNVTGGLFNVQEQVSYTNLGSAPYDEHNFFINTFINADVQPKWNLGIIVPMVYKYLDDPMHVAPDGPPINYSNGGLGDVSLLLTRRVGPTNATSLTGIVGFPTGVWDAAYPGGRVLNQNAQLGYGKTTGSLVVDHTVDKIWGLAVVGGFAAWRGGHNELDNYRAPTAGLYGYTGYFVGPFVPSFGLILSGFKGHDYDQNSEQTTPLVSLGFQGSLEWATDWVAVLVAVSRAYKYDGMPFDESQQPRSQWGFMPWTFALGVAFAPF
jgi:hypothetical protein